MRDLVKNRNQTVFTGRVDRVSNSGNGIIELEHGHLNLGPVPNRVVGEEVKGVLTSNAFSGPPIAYCVNEECITTEYLEWAAQKFKPELINIYNYPKTVNVKIQRRTGSENAIAHDPRSSRPILVASPPDGVESGDIVKIRLRHTNAQHSGNIRAEFVRNVERSEEYEKIIEEWVKEAKRELNINEVRESSIDIDIKSGGDYEKIDSATSTEQHTSKQPESTISTGQHPTEDLDQLKKQAQKDSTENVTQSSVSRAQTTQQYRRSQAVREYVMSRADGVCEGCGEPAPFISKTSDPYLHAHHIYELSDGGSDTPSTVIALCPNCHYRVHHGKDGDKYNNKLEQRLSEIEE